VELLTRYLQELTLPLGWTKLRPDSSLRL